MEIITLMEDTRGEKDCLYEHGLSVYVHAKERRYLFDFGASDKILENARALGIDLGEVDTAVLSHGHYDHSGGLKAFRSVNQKADIYMMASAGEKHVHKIRDVYKDIGIDETILTLPGITFVRENRKVNDELSLFSGVSARRFPARGNKSLLVEKNGTYMPDDFAHELYAILETEGRRILISGCAHNGIVNILDACEKLYGWYPDMVIGGFHMILNHYHPDDIDRVQETGKVLRSIPADFYTGHCTGETAIDLLKQIMGEKLHVIHSGTRIL